MDSFIMKRSKYNCSTYVSACKDFSSLSFKNIFDIKLIMKTVEIIVVSSHLGHSVKRVSSSKMKVCNIS